MSVDSKMTAIADAIRAKTGGTEALTLDGMAEAIVAIEAGGGFAVRCGTVTLAEDTRFVRVSGDFNEIPKLVLFANLGTGETNRVSDDRSKLSLLVFSEWFLEDPTRAKNHGLLAQANDTSFFVSWYTYGTSYYNNSYISVFPTYIEFGGSGVNEAYTMDAGDTYIYIIVG